MLKDNGLGAAKEVIVGQPEFLKEVSAMLKARAHRRPEAVPALAPGEQRDRGPAQGLRRRELPLLAGAERRQKAAAPLEAHAARRPTAPWAKPSASSTWTRPSRPPPRPRAKEMIENLRAAYAERIKATDWMSAATKKEALKKLNAFTVKIGYPDKWKDYSALNISRETLPQQPAGRPRVGQQRRTSSKFGKPIDRNEWGMTPPTVNAYYNPPMNEIVFPAGILQPPFYDPKADDAVNYGGIGAVIGHEMTHGFDDQGRQYDAKGNLRDWWTKEDADKFNATRRHGGQAVRRLLAPRLGARERQADHGRKPGRPRRPHHRLPGLRENPAGQGQAKHRRLHARAALLPGLGPDLAHQRPPRVPAPAGADRPALARPSSAPTARCMNMPEFYEAFGCKDGSQDDARPGRPRQNLVGQQAWVYALARERHAGLPSSATAVVCPADKGSSLSPKNESFTRDKVLRKLRTQTTAVALPRQARHDVLFRLPILHFSSCFSAQLAVRLLSYLAVDKMNLVFL